MSYRTNHADAVNAGSVTSANVSDPLFDTYVAYRLSAPDQSRSGRGPTGGGSGCGCFVLLLLLSGVATALVHL